MGDLPTSETLSRVACKIYELQQNGTSPYFSKLAGLLELEGITRNTVSKGLIVLMEQGVLTEEWDTTNDGNVKIFMISEPAKDFIRTIYEHTVKTSVPVA